MSEDQIRAALEGINTHLSEIKSDFKEVWGAVDSIRDNTHKMELHQESRLSTLEAQFKNNKWLLGLVVVLVFGVASRVLLK